METTLPVSVVIPTYRRERVLVQTIEYLLALSPPADEILVLDQTEQHEAATEQALQQLAQRGAIRWERLAEPSIPKAMNQGLLRARHELVLFVDDDVRPEPALLDAHRAAHLRYGKAIVAGRVIQPWQEGVDFSSDPTVHLAGTREGEIVEFIGCNFSVRRSEALSIGGFDENFVRVAYRFEAEFAHRFRRSGGRIWFEPAACLHHLKEDGGGTRSYGRLLKTWRPDHSVGVYYYALRTGDLLEMALQPRRALINRHHMRYPWHLPRSLLAEILGFIWAIRLIIMGPKLLSSGFGERS